MVRTIQIAPESDLGRQIEVSTASGAPLIVDVGGQRLSATFAPAIAKVTPAWLRGLMQAIAASRSLLDLPDDWDDEGAPAYDEATWERAARLLADGIERLWADFGVQTILADVLPGPAGSIDLDWRAAGRELLINVPADPSAPWSYYGDDGKGGRSVKGTLDPAAPNRWLLAWLAE